jgi:tetratricopeptide (TPR) repeat protein
MRIFGNEFLARVAFEKHQPDQAIWYLRTADAEAQNVGMVEHLGAHALDEASIECSLRRIESCIEHIGKALSLKPGPNSSIYASSILGEAVANERGAPNAESRKALNELKEIESTLPKPGLGAISEMAALRIRGEILLAEGNLEQALTEFRKAEAIDAPTGEKGYLARALLAAARNEPDASRARDLRLAALDAYGAVALHPNFFLQLAPKSPLTLVTQQADAYLRLELSLGVNK